MNWKFFGATALFVSAALHTIISRDKSMTTISYCIFCGAETDFLELLCKHICKTCALKISRYYAIELELDFLKPKTLGPENVL